ncbi:MULTISPECIES: hypothetical protein [Nocardia]|uniref:Uncharacterized protein n=1 Tax=Nocardia nova TaxID=37330 RepID=A0A2T2Z8B5_9NOCA|nr:MULTISPECIES: hypothetical protein [Nocardia]PSR63995.1 hypothetical protein C8259_09100 [Nocardia nova]
MTKPPLFAIEDVQEYSGETYTDAAEITQVTRFIARASAQMRSSVAGIDERLVDGRLDPETVKGIGAAMVLRALDTLRRGIRVTRTEYPEVSESYSDGGDAAASLVYLTAGELDELTDTPDTGESFTIRTGRY